MLGLFSVVSEAGSVSALSVAPSPVPSFWACSCPFTGPFCSAAASSLGSSTLGLGLVTTGLHAANSSWKISAYVNRRIIYLLLLKIVQNFIALIVWIGIY